MKSFWILSGILLLFGVTSVSYASEKEYYTQFNIWVFKSETTTDNFAVERIVPVNSKVRIVKVKDHEAELQMDDTKFVMIIDRMHSKKTIMDQLKLYLKSEPVDLTKFSAVGRSAINSGAIQIGITKEEALIARGYPPEHATPSLDNDTWRYWQNRWHSILVYFENNKVKKISP